MNDSDYWVTELAGFQEVLFDYRFDLPGRDSMEVYRVFDLDYDWFVKWIF